MATTIKSRRGTATEWNAANPILAVGEIGVDLTNRKHKIGDGISTWSALPYFITEPAIDNKLATRALTNHSHDWSDVTGKPATFPPSVHTHSSANIVDFVEATQDAVASMLTSGANVSLIYDDANNQLVVEATGADVEQMRDAIGAALVGVGNISVAINDAADTITISTAATVNRTDAATDILINAKAPLADPALTGNATVDGQAIVKTNDSRLSDARTPTIHSHTKSQITDFAHTHPSTEVSGLGTSATRNVGSVAGTVAAGDDTRLTDARPPTAHSHTKSQITDFAHTHPSTEVSGLGNSATRNVGTSSNTVAAGDDSRFTDARPPTAHIHTASQISDFTEAAQDAIGALLSSGSNVSLTYDDANNQLVINATGADAESMRDIIGAAIVGVGNISVAVNDAADTITISTTATVNRSDTDTDQLLAQKAPIANAELTGNATLDGQALVKTNDARLSDARPPTLHGHPSSHITGLGTSATRDVGTTAGTVAAGDDFRLGNARTPTAHTHTKDNITDFAHTHPSTEVSGLGTAATRDVGTTTNTVAAGDDARFSDARNPLAHVHTAAQISDFTEAAQDAVAALLTSGSNVSLAYDDANNQLVVTASGGDAELMRDTIGSAMVGVGLISVVVNDAADTITISTTATANRTDAATDALLNAKAPLAAPALTGSATLDGQALVKTNDARLSDSRTPTAHSHTKSQITDFAHTHVPADVVGLGTSATRNVGVAANTVAAGDDSRLTDARTPLAHSHTAAQISDFTEAAQDAVAAMLSSGSNVTLNYDDTNNQLVVSATGGDAETMRDTIGAALVGVGNISVTVNDAADTITISTTATVNRTDAATDTLLNAKAPLASPALTGSATLDGQAIVKTNDTRLSDARTPTTHSHDWSSGVTSKPLSVTLLGGLTPAADKLAYYTSSAAAALADLTSFGRSLIAAGSSSAARTLLDVYSKAEVASTMQPASLMGRATIKGSTAVTSVVPANTVIGGSAGRIAGLAVTVVGEGRPVIISLTIPSYVNTNGTGTSNIGIAQGTTSLQMISVKAPGTAAPGALIDFEATSDILAVGTSYTFYAFGRQNPANAGSIHSHNDYPSELRVQRG